MIKVQFFNLLVFLLCAVMIVCVIELELNYAVGEIAAKEREILKLHGKDRKITVRVQHVGQFFGMAGDLPEVDYTWPRPIFISSQAYAHVQSVADGAQCARERGARLAGDQPHVVALRGTFTPTTFYCEYFSNCL